jgi:hypothetical protein
VLIVDLVEEQHNDFTTNGPAEYHDVGGPGFALLRFVRVSNPR